VSLGPDEMARLIQRRHAGWSVWYGRHTGQFWALARWVRGPYAMVSAPTPETLDAAIAVFETIHPKPGRRDRHGVGA
jgi:hypothetical protein